MRLKLLKLYIGAILVMTSTTQALADKQSHISTKTVNAEELFDPAPYGFSHAVVVKGAQNIAYIAGQGGEDKDGNLKDDFGFQVRQAYKNLMTAIKSAGASPQHVTKLTTYVVDHEQSKLKIMTQELKAVFKDHLPAQTLVPVPRLALDGMLFEVDAIVVLKE